MNAALLEALFGNFPEAQKGVKDSGSVMTAGSSKGRRPWCGRLRVMQPRLRSWPAI